MSFRIFRQMSSGGRRGCRRKGGLGRCERSSGMGGALGWFVWRPASSPGFALSPPLRGRLGGGSWGSLSSSKRSDPTDESLRAPSNGSRSSSLARAVLLGVGWWTLLASLWRFWDWVRMGSLGSGIVVSGVVIIGGCPTIGSGSTSMGDAGSVRGVQATRRTLLVGGGMWSASKLSYRAENGGL